MALPQVVIVVVDDVIFIGVGGNVAGHIQRVAPDGEVRRGDRSIAIEVARQSVGVEHQRRHTVAREGVSSQQA